MLFDYARIRPAARAKVTSADFILMALSVLSAAGSDLWITLWPEIEEEVPRLMIILSGLFLLKPSWRHLRVGALGAVVSALHVAAMFLAASVDTRTFYGGAAVPIIGTAAWIVVFLMVLIASGGGWLFRRQKAKASVQI